MKNSAQEQRAVELLVPHHQDERPHGVESAVGARIRDAAGGRSFHSFLSEGQEGAMTSVTQNYGASLIKHPTQVRVIKQSQQLWGENT